MANDVLSKRESSLLSDASFSTLGAVASTGISGIASIIIARDLGATSRGRWAVIGSLAVIVSTFASAGLPSAVAYAGARLRGDDRLRLSQAAIIAGALLAAVAVLMYLGAAAVIRPPARIETVLVGLAIPAATVCYAVLRALTLTTVSVRWYAMAQVVSAGATLAAVLTLTFTTGVTVLTVVVISAAGQLVGGATCALGLHRRRIIGPGRMLPRGGGGIEILRPYLTYAVITFATLSLTQVVQRFDVLLVNGYRGPRSAGLYAVAVQLTDLMLVVPAALGFVMFRRGARDSANHYPDAVRVLVFAALFGVTASAAALLLSGWAIPLVFGAAYRGAVAPLRWLLPGVIAFSAQSVLSSYLAGRGRPRVVLIAWLLGAVFGIGADLFVIPADGVVGAAVVSSLSYVLVTLLHVRAMRAARPSAAP